LVRPQGTLTSLITLNGVLLVSLSNFVILYVDNPLKSGEFYTQLLGREPLEAHPTFVGFTLNENTGLGLWSKHTAEPLAMGGPGFMEVALVVKDKNEVDQYYHSWAKCLARVAQKPMQMDFGYTFTVLDPDGHRLRVFCED
jgi:catechol 2,3-dioxygenase-like lactoylglutathione lyase family enzyme